MLKSGNRAPSFLRPTPPLSPTPTKLSSETAGRSGSVTRTGRGLVTRSGRLGKAAICTLYAIVALAMCLRPCLTLSAAAAGGFVGRARTPPGPADGHGCRILDENQAVQLYRHGHDNRASLRELSDKYGVSQRTIRDVWNRRSWVKATRAYWTRAEIAEYDAHHGEWSDLSSGPGPGRPTKVDIIPAEILSKFHMSQPDAAKALGMSVRALSNKCRQYGLTRWPRHSVSSPTAMEPSPSPLAMPPLTLPPTDAGARDVGAEDARGKRTCMSRGGGVSGGGKMVKMRGDNQSIVNSARFEKQSGGVEENGAENMEETVVHWSRHEVEGVALVEDGDAKLLLEHLSSRYLQQYGSQPTVGDLKMWEVCLRSMRVDCTEAKMLGNRQYHQVVHLSCLYLSKNRRKARTPPPTNTFINNAAQDSGLSRKSSVVTWLPMRRDVRGGMCGEDVSTHQHPQHTAAKLRPFKTALKSKYMFSKTAKCAVGECAVTPSYADPEELLKNRGKAAWVCKRHKGDHFVNVRRQTRCQHLGCDKHARFGSSQQRLKARCDKHKFAADMLLQPNHSSRCAAGDALGGECQRRPIWGQRGAGARHCAQHKVQGEEDVVHKHCEYRRCGKQASFGDARQGLTARFCKWHKLGGHTRVRSNGYTRVQCDKRARKKLKRATKRHLMEVVVDGEVLGAVGRGAGQEQGSGALGGAGESWEDWGGWFKRKLCGVTGVEEVRGKGGGECITTGWRVVHPPSSLPLQPLEMVPFGATIVG